MDFLDIRAATDRQRPNEMTSLAGPFRILRKPAPFAKLSRPLREIMSILVMLNQDKRLS